MTSRNIKVVKKETMVNMELMLDGLTELHGKSPLIELIEKEHARWFYRVANEDDQWLYLSGEYKLDGFTEWHGRSPVVNLSGENMPNGLTGWQ